MANEWAPDTPRDALMRMIIGYRRTQLVALAARLGIADRLAEGPRSADELANATKSHPEALYRALRALASIGVFKETKGRLFELTPMSVSLLTARPDSLRAQAIWAGSEIYEAFGDLPYTVTTGENAFRHHYGKSLFEYLAEHPLESDIFNQTMSTNVKELASVTLDAYDFSWAHTVVDVAGGEGTLLSSVLRAHPTLHGVLFDQPHVIPSAVPVLRAAGVADRCEVVGGNFFERVPPGADLYTLRQVIHDWDDEQAITILRNCAEAMDPQGKVALIETPIGERHSAAAAAMLDIVMMVMAGGRERTVEEYGHLFAAAGLRLTRVIPTHSPDCVIEAEHA